MKRSILAALLALFVFCLTPGPMAAAKEYMVAGSHPNNLMLIDLAARKVERVYRIPGRGFPLTIAPSPDGKVVYVLTDRWGAISGIDLDSGKEVFRANMSAPWGDGIKRRVKSITFALSRDGREIFAYQVPVELHPWEFKVNDTRFAVYKTDAGTDARPARTFKAPRRISTLATSVDGSRLYGAGWDLYGFDTTTGEIAETHRLRTWDFKNHGEPDVLNFWQQFEQADVWSTPYYVATTNPDDFMVGLATMDLKTKQFKVHDFESIQVIIFSSVISPTRPEAFMVYTTLSKLDLNTYKVVKRVDLDHTYYAVNISADGNEIYVGGTMDDIGVYNRDLKKIGMIKLPGGADQSIANIRVFNR